MAPFFVLIRLSQKVLKHKKDKSGNEYVKTERTVEVIEGSDG